MKKILIICVFIFGSLITNAQGNYTVDFEIEQIEGAYIRTPFGTFQVSWSGNCGSFFKSYLIFDDTSAQEYFYQPVGDGQGTPRNWSAEFPNSKKLSKINVYSEARKYHGGLNSGCDADFRSHVDVNVTHGVTEYYLDQNYTPTYRLRATLKVLPKLYIIPKTEQTLPVDERITIASTSGFLPVEYNWQYSLDASNWIDLNQYDEESSIDVSAQDILGAQAENFHGASIYFRQTAYNGQRVSLTREYKIRKSAPHISSIETNATKCFYTNDGSVKIKLDRPRLSNEILYCSLYNNTTNMYEPLPNNSDLVLDSDNSYEIINLPASNYTFQVGIGSYNGFNTYTTANNHKIVFDINKPTKVDFTLSKVDVWCHGGNDGNITINATGGNIVGANDDTSKYFYEVNGNGNWLPFSGVDTHTIPNLVSGIYKIKVRDFKGCYARTPQDTDKELTIAIAQPTTSVSLNYTEIKQPAFYGATNGRIVAAITGGTRFDDDSYTYEWKNSTGVVQTVATYYDVASKIYYLTLNGIPSDTYTLTVTDKNYVNATNQTGCTVANSVQYLGQPDPIVVNLELIREISCNVSNQFGNETDMNPYDGQRDESQDGILKATVTGGVPYTGGENNGQPYKFFWKKQQTNGTWVDWNDFDATAENLSHGNYSLNVEDKNGIRLGIYMNNQISQETPMTYFMQQPEKFELAFEKGDISCGLGNNGWVKVIPAGGVPPYTYAWTNGENSNQINDLTANNYFVKVTDSKGCVVQGSIVVQQPNGVDITGTIIPPSCHNGNDGAIQVTINGGTSPYTYTWNTNATSKDISGLTSGMYDLKVVDANNCTYFKSFELINPEAVTVNLGNDRTLCNNQSLDFNIAINDPQAQYSWTSSNGFISASPSVSITKAGVYTAKVVSSKGCIGQDDVIVKTNNVAISSEFFLTSQAYLNDEVILVNASNPLGENTTWEIPATVSVVTETENYIVLKFNALGSYTISLKQTQGDCYALYSKVINVEQKTINDSIGNSSNPFIEEYIVTPNPTNGNFNAIVKLRESSPIKLRLYSLTGQQPLIEKSEAGLKSYVVDFNLNIAGGTYALILETAKQTLIKKIIIY